MAEATCRLGSPISLDLSVTADNTLVPRFFARHPEPLAEGAEGADSPTQPDWGRSRCSCVLMHRECVFAFPPREILPEFVAGALGRHAWGRRHSVHAI